MTFHAGLELARAQLGLWAAALSVRAGLVRDWSRYADTLSQTAAWLDRFGTSHGGMLVMLDGIDTRARRLARGDHPEPGPAASAVLHRLMRVWTSLGAVAFVAMVALFALMVFKAGLAEPKTR